MAIIGVIAFVVALLLSVMIHEAGHYLTAKRFGMKVTEFFVGFGQKIWSTQRGETEFGVKAIPAGGYCRIAGMTPREELSEADADRAFVKAGVTQRLIVLGAGSFLHFVIGFVLLLTLFSAIGVTSLTNQVERVSDCIPQTATEVCSSKSTPSPAKNAGILAGDQIISINGVEYTEWAQAVRVIRSSAGKQLDITVNRNGGLIDILVTPAFRDLDGEKIGVIGVINKVGTVTYAPIPAVIKAGSFTLEILQNSLTALISLPSKIPDLINQTFGNEERDPEGLVGVVGVARVSGETAETKALTGREKIATFVLIIASLNLFVGMFNLLPLLPLDGGHMAVAIADGVRNTRAKAKGLAKPAPFDVERLTPITMVVFILMASLSLLLLTADILNPVRLNF
ncbi:MAG: site-2 protease family protein [Candidatus Nanopelagicus sp.]|jgi:membrane-associated protease RseP (regulator of RpoE activity)|nr:site-2 protease family protein [Candidatus Nanopelagicus sp.]